jgi:hypothetical protein
LRYGPVRWLHSPAGWAPPGWAEQAANYITHRHATQEENRRTDEYPLLFCDSHWNLASHLQVMKTHENALRTHGDDQT